MGLFQASVRSCISLYDIRYSLGNVGQHWRFSRDCIIHKLNLEEVEYNHKVLQLVTYWLVLGVLQILCTRTFYTVIQALVTVKCDFAFKYY